MMGEAEQATCSHYGQCLYCNGVSLVDEGHYFMTGDITSQSVHTWRRDLMMMAYNRHRQVKPDLSRHITVWLETQGGSVPDGMALFEQMRYIRQTFGLDLSVFVMGSAASFGSVLVQAASPGGRVASRRAKLLIHEMRGPGLNTTMSGHQQMLDYWAKGWKDMCEIYAETNTRGHTDPRWWARKIKGNEWWITAQEALDYGLVDAVI